MINSTGRIRFGRVVGTVSMGGDENATTAIGCKLVYKSVSMGGNEDIATAIGCKSVSSTSECDIQPYS